MPSKYDIFISYGHLDDDDPAGDVKGWVDLLVERLPRLISSTLGYQPKVWRDERSLTGDALLRAAIEEGISNSLIFIPIVSPRYVQSDWCLRELETFCKHPPLPNAPAHRSRIFKVIKSPLLFHLAKKEPDALRELIGYAFYEMEGDMPVEFSPDVVPAKDPRYWTVLRRLAWDISTLLAVVKEPDKRATKELPTEGPQKFVYLAETTSDLAQERELVRDELRQRGYGVVPEEKLPTEELKETEAAILKALGRSILSVHLIGKRYGAAPEDDPRSIVSIQEDLSARRCTTDSSFTASAVDAAGPDDARARSHGRASKNFHYESSKPHRLRRRAAANKHRRFEDAHRRKTQPAGENRGTVETKRSLKTETGLSHLREPRSQSGATY